MTGRALVAAMLAVWVLSGCGSDQSASLSFPTGHRAEGRFVVPVSGSAQASQLCDATDQWPVAYPDQVVFDPNGGLPLDGGALVCVRGHLD